MVAMTLSRPGKMLLLSFGLAVIMTVHAQQASAQTARNGSVANDSKRSSTS
jgi:hypothetical protein